MNPELEDILAGLREPDPEPPKPKGFNILPSGREILKRIEAYGEVLPEADKKEILEISDDEALAQFMAANLSPQFNPSEMEANSIFSGWLMRKINVPPMLLTLQFDTLNQSTRAINYCYEELAKDNPPLLPVERNQILRVLVEAIKQRGTLIKNALQMAQMAKPNDGKKKPKNAPPDTLTKPTQVVVQINNQVQAKREDETRPILESR